MGRLALTRIPSGDQSASSVHRLTDPVTVYSTELPSVQSILAHSFDSHTCVAQLEITSHKDQEVKTILLHMCHTASMPCTSQHPLSRMHMRHTKRASLSPVASCQLRTMTSCRNLRWDGSAAAPSSTVWWPSNASKGGPVSNSASVSGSSLVASRLVGLHSTKPASYEKEYAALPSRTHF